MRLMSVASTMVHTSSKTIVASASLPAAPAMKVESFLCGDAAALVRLLRL